MVLPSAEVHVCDLKAIVTLELEILFVLGVNLFNVGPLEEDDPLDADVVLGRVVVHAVARDDVVALGPQVQRVAALPQHAFERRHFLWAHAVFS